MSQPQLWIGIPEGCENWWPCRCAERDEDGKLIVTYHPPRDRRCVVCRAKKPTHQRKPKS